MHWGEDPAGFCLATSGIRLPCRPYRLKVINAETGRAIEGRWCNKIYENTSVEWLLRLVAEELDWPPRYVELTIGQTIVGLARRGSERTLLKDYVSFNEEHVLLQAIKCPRPEFFDDQGLCMCNFGGCCRDCMVPARFVCTGCGNNGCCQAGNCGHQCCEERKARSEVRCPLAGCRPWWAQESESSCPRIARGLESQESVVVRG